VFSLSSGALNFWDIRTCTLLVDRRSASPYCLLGLAGVVVYRPTGCFAILLTMFNLKPEYSLPDDERHFRQYSLIEAIKSQFYVYSKTIK